MQEAISVAIMQILKFYCNYAGATFCYTHAGGSFCCNDAGDCFCCNLQLEVCAAFMQVKFFAANMLETTSVIEIMQVGVCLIMQVAFPAAHMTISIVIMQVTVSVVAMYDSFK